LQNLYGIGIGIGTKPAKLAVALNRRQKHIGGYQIIDSNSCRNSELDKTKTKALNI